MAAGGRLTVTARTRRLYTGEPIQYIKEALRTLPKQQYLPSARGAQAVLESKVLACLVLCRGWFAHPLGIAGIRLYPAQTLINLDGQVGGFGARDDMGTFAARHLLPIAEPDIEIRGVPGLRVAAITGADLNLTLVDGGGRLTLRSSSNTNWKQCLADLHRGALVDGNIPVWDAPALTSHEREDRMIDPTDITAESYAWLGSGLLRRIALFHTTSSAYSTSSWITGNRWIFELDTHHEIPLRHDRLLDRLMDPVWGLPLQIAKDHCNCAGQSTYAARSLQCTYDLSHRDSDTGTLQIRFRRHANDDGGEARESLRSLNADRAWLDRVLPRRVATTPMPRSPLIKRRRLGSKLQGLRLAAGVTIDYVAANLGWTSVTKVARIEIGRSRSEPGDVSDLLNLYKVSGVERDRIMDLALAAADIDGWFREYETVRNDRQPPAGREPVATEGR